jgi:hypothetical protein
MRGCGRGVCVGSVTDTRNGSSRWRTFGELTIYDNPWVWVGQIPHHQRPAAGPGTEARRRPTPGAPGEGLPAAGSLGLPRRARGHRVHQHRREQVTPATRGTWPNTRREMLIPFPDDDEPRRRVADFPRGSPATARQQRDPLRDAPGPQATGDHQEHQRVELAGKKDKAGRTVDERWADPSDGGSSQRRHARRPRHQGLHLHPAEVEKLIAMTAAMLCITP